MTNKFGNTVFQNAELLYDALLAKSELAEAQHLVPYGYPSDGDVATVFYGIATTVGGEVGLSKSAHTHAMSLLRFMDCVTTLKVGSHATPSVYLLNYKPTRKQFDDWRVDRSETSTRISPSKADVLKQDLSDARVRIKVLERSARESNDSILTLTQAVKELQTQFFNLQDKLDSSGRDNVRGS